MPPATTALDRLRTTPSPTPRGSHPTRRSFRATAPALARQPRLATPRGWLGRSLCAPDPYGAGPPGTDLVHKVDLCCGRNRFGQGPGSSPRCWHTHQARRSCPGHARIRAGGELTVGVGECLGSAPEPIPATAASTPPRSGSHRDATTPGQRLGSGVLPLDARKRPGARSDIGSTVQGAVGRAGARTSGRGLGHLVTCPRSRPGVPCPCSGPKSPPTAHRSPPAAAHRPSAARRPPPAAVRRPRPRAHRPPAAVHRPPPSAARARRRRPASAGGGCRSAWVCISRASRRRLGA